MRKQNAKRAMSTSTTTSLRCSQLDVHVHKVYRVWYRRPERGCLVAFLCTGTSVPSSLSVPETFLRPGHACSQLGKFPCYVCCKAPECVRTARMQHAIQSFCPFSLAPRANSRRHVQDCSAGYHGCRCCAPTIFDTRLAGGRSVPSFSPRTR